MSRPSPACVFVLSLFSFVMVVAAACSSTSDHGPPAVGCTDPSCATGNTVTGHDAADDVAPDAAIDSSRPDADAVVEADADVDETPPLPTSCDDPTVTGNLAIIDGNIGDPVLVGPEVIGGPFPGVFDVILAKPDTAVVRAKRDVDSTTLVYAFSTEQTGSAMVAGTTYINAWRYPDEPVGKPGFNIEVNGTTCTILGTASFTIVDIAVDPVDSHLVRLFAKFTRTCDEGGEAMTGCIRYAEPSASDAGADGG